MISLGPLLIHILFTPISRTKVILAFDNVELQGWVTGGYPDQFDLRMTGSEGSDFLLAPSIGMGDLTWSSSQETWNVLK